MSKPNIEEKIGGYDMTWADVKIKISVTRIKQHRDNRITGWLMFSNTAVKEPGLIHQCELNFASSQTHRALVNMLAEKDDKPPWDEIIEQCRYYILDRTRQGEPVEVISTASEGITPPTYLIYPLLPKDQPTIIYGEPGVGKSRVANLLYICLTLPWHDNPLGLIVPDVPMRPLILDWETDRNTTASRIRAIVEGMGLGPIDINYRRCLSRISDDLEQIQLAINKVKANCLIVDSLTAACGGELMKPETAEEFFTALRKLKMTAFIIGQTQKDPELRTKSVLGCYAEGTEVLTKTGWKQHREITLTDEVACYEHNNQPALRWLKPTNTLKYAYSGYMIKIKHGAFQALVTPNHRIITTNHGVINAEKLLHFKNPAYKIPHGAKLKPYGQHLGKPKGIFQMEGGSKRLPLVSWLKFLGYWISEGNLGHCSAIALSQTIGKTLEEMKTTLNRLGFSYADYTVKRQNNWKELHHLVIRYDAGEKSRFNKNRLLRNKGFGNKVTGKKHLLYRWLALNCGHNVYNKHIPEFIWSLRRNQQKVFLNALIAGDGHVEANGSAQYFTASKELADGVQRLATLCGFGNYMTSRKRYPSTALQYEIHMSKPQRKTLTIAPPNVNRESYQGMVYCLTVPTGFYVTRYNGYVNILGNSTIFEYYARSLWEIKKAQSAGEDEMHVALIHRKANESKLHKSLTYRFYFNEDHITVSRADMADIPEFNRDVPLRVRIRESLSHGALTAKDLADNIDAKAGTVSKTLSDMKRKGSVISLPENKWGLPARV